MPKAWPQNKYRNRPCVIDGKWFQSTKEGHRYQELRLLEKAGEISHLKTQVRFPIVVNGEKVCVYVSDFTYRTLEGDDVVEDTKGVRTDIYKLKAKLLWATQRIIIRET